MPEHRAVLGFGGSRANQTFKPLPPTNFSVGLGLLFKGKICLIVHETDNEIVLTSTGIVTVNRAVLISFIFI